MKRATRSKIPVRIRTKNLPSKSTANNSPPITVKKMLGDLVEPEHVPNHSNNRNSIDSILSMYSNAHTRHASLQSQDDLEHTLPAPMIPVIEVGDYDYGEEGHEAEQHGAGEQGAGEDHAQEHKKDEDYAEDNKMEEGGANENEAEQEAFQATCDNHQQLLEHLKVLQQKMDELLNAYPRSQAASQPVQFPLLDYQVSAKIWADLMSGDSDSSDDEDSEEEDIEDDIAHGSELEVKEMEEDQKDNDAIEAKWSNVRQLLGQIKSHRQKMHDALREPSSPGMSALSEASPEETIPDAVIFEDEFNDENDETLVELEADAGVADDNVDVELEIDQDETASDYLSCGDAAEDEPKEAYLSCGEAMEEESDGGYFSCDEDIDFDRDMDGLRPAVNIVDFLKAIEEQCGAEKVLNITSCAILLMVFATGAFSS